jgi:hypothetical protein
LFAGLLKSKVFKKAAVKRANDLVAEDILASTAAANKSLKVKKSKSSVEGYASANPSLSFNSMEGGSSRRQLGVLTSFEKSTIDGCNSADLDAANCTDGVLQGSHVLFWRVSLLPTCYPSNPFSTQGIHPTKEDDVVW